MDEIRAFAPDIARRRKTKYGQTKVVVERQKTFPVDPLSILITIGIYVGLKVADKLIEKITEDVYKMVKEKLRDRTVTKAGNHRSSQSKHP